MASDIAQTQLPTPTDERISHISIFSDFFDPAPQSLDFLALKLSLPPEYFRDVDLTLCAMAESYPKHTALLARAASPLFRSIQVTHANDYLATRAAHEEAADLANSTPIKTKCKPAATRSMSI